MVQNHARKNVLKARTAKTGEGHAEANASAGRTRFAGFTDDEMSEVWPSPALNNDLSEALRDEWEQEMQTRMRATASDNNIRAHMARSGQDYATSAEAVANLPQIAYVENRAGSGSQWTDGWGYVYFTDEYRVMFANSKVSLARTPHGELPVTPDDDPNYGSQAETLRVILARDYLEYKTGQSFTVDGEVDDDAAIDDDDS